MRHEEICEEAGGEVVGERCVLPHDDAELAAFHEVQLGLEKMRIAEGKLTEFHHNVGGGMDHLEEAKEKFRESGNDDIADRIEKVVLPVGAIDGEWTYKIVEDFRGGFMDHVENVTEDILEDKVHVRERQMHSNKISRSR